MMRVNIIGHYKKGKTTVLRNICKHASNQKKEFSMFTSSTDQSMSHFTNLMHSIQNSQRHL